jgi:hypothetical protein
MAGGKLTFQPKSNQHAFDHQKSMVGRGFPGKQVARF